MGRSVLSLVVTFAFLKQIHGFSLLISTRGKCTTAAVGSHDYDQSFGGLSRDNRFSGGFQSAFYDQSDDSLRQFTRLYSHNRRFEQDPTSHHKSHHGTSSTSLFSTLPDNPTASTDEELLEHLDELAPVHFQNNSMIEKVLSSYLGPRLILGVLAAVYATNFPLGALMNDSLPASAATCARMVVAGLALSPAVFQLHPNLRLPSVLCGCFTAAGYISQSLALDTVDPAKVSFLGSATVLWCPLLEALIDKKPMGIKESPQIWLAALMSLAGVGVLELYDPSSSMSVLDTLTHVSTGDLFALLQAVGFGTGVWWTSRMLKREPDQALSVTATLIATTAAISSVWCVLDGWVLNPDNYSYTLPGMMTDESLRTVFLAVLWTGLISTSLNFFIELTALGRVPPSEASVILASEPLWAAVFASLLYHTSLSSSDWMGGSLLIAACLVNALITPELLFGKKEKESEGVEEESMEVEGVKSE